MKTYRDIFATRDKAVLIPFFVLGDPDYDRSLMVIKGAIDAGADILELGIPFSDPIADGPTIQKADIRALKAGMTCEKALDLIRQIKAYADIPIGLLMYYNLIYHYGRDRFYLDVAAAGVNSVLVADVSIDDADEVAGPASAAGLDTVFMVTPITRPERMRLIASRTTGFIYTVSLLGVTGARSELSDMAENLVGRLKGLTDVPVCVGFGISRPEHAAAVAQAGADGVIIGSKIVDLIENNLDDTEKALAEITAFITQVKAAI
ncbi:MAG: tryptophan synthase subunit alpha [Phycisphaerales bacterium]|nr:MAG: tryptophan synthase subunit alpha [Phycisphaerales bacterium]